MEVYLVASLCPECYCNQCDRRVLKLDRRKEVWGERMDERKQKKNK